MKSMQMSKGSVGLSLFLVLSGLIVLSLLGAKIFPDTQVFGLVVVLLLITLSVFTVSTDKQWLNKCVAFCFIIFFVTYALVHFTGNRIHPLTHYLLYVADILFSIGLVASTRSSSDKRKALLLYGCFALAILAFIVCGTFHLQRVQLVLSSVLILLLSYITIKNRQGANFLILCQLAIVLIDGLAESAPEFFESGGL